MMPRQMRREFAGAIYHVMNRGDRREEIFRNEDDRRMFLDTLSEACGKTGWQIHAYCLMRNHFQCELVHANQSTGRAIEIDLARRTASRLRTLPQREKQKITYIKLNIQTACPPRTAVPVNQGCCGRFFHSQHPDRPR